MAEQTRTQVHSAEPKRADCFPEAQLAEGGGKGDEVVPNLLSEGRPAAVPSHRPRHIMSKHPAPRLPSP